jgi:hypothetical protein
VQSSTVTLLIGIIERLLLMRFMCEIYRKNARRGKTITNGKDDPYPSVKRKLPPPSENNGQGKKKGRQS